MKFPKIDIVMIWSLGPSLLFATVATSIVAIFHLISWWLVFITFFIIFMLFVYPAAKLEDDRWGNKPSTYEIIENMAELMTEEDEDETIKKITLDDSNDN